MKALIFLMSLGLQYHVSSKRKKKSDAKQVTNLTKTMMGNETIQAPRVNGWYLFQSITKKSCVHCASHNSGFLVVVVVLQYADHYIIHQLNISHINN